MFDGITHEAPFLSHLYRGYDVSPQGSVIGLVWALVDGGVGGAIFAWLYNCIAGKCAK